MYHNYVVSSLIYKNNDKFAQCLIYYIRLDGCNNCNKPQIIKYSGLAIGFGPFLGENLWQLGRLA